MTVNQANVTDSPPANILPAASSRASLLAKGEIVEILVGQDKTKYKLYKNMLIAKSPYFATSLKDCWNGKTNEIDLTDEDASTFDAFVDWLYEGSIEVSRSIGVCEDWLPSHITLTLKVYKLAEKFMVNGMKNSLLDAVKDRFGKRGQSANIHALCNLHSHEGSDTQLYRMFLRDCVAFYMKSPAQFDGETNGMGMLVENPEVAKDMLESIRDYNKAPWDYMREAGRCEYHDHTDGSKCD